MSDKKNMAIRNDHWTIIDGLGFGPTGDQLAKLIMLAEPPFAAGVTGKWGSGKTSLMRYAMARLGGLPISSHRPGTVEPVAEVAGELDKQWKKQTEDAPAFLKRLLPPQGDPAGGEAKTESTSPDVRCVWYSPWQYQGDPNPLVPLLHEIREQMGVWMKAKQEISKLTATAMESGIGLLMDLADSAFSLGGALGKLTARAQKTGERIEKERFETPTDAQRFHLQFERAIELVLGGDTKSPQDRLVIFVDDLDRCADERVLQVLQMIKLYLSTRRCVFVLGIDRDAVEKAVARVWDGKSEREACEYIEKLFQAMVYVPVSQSYDEFIRSQLARSGVPLKGGRHKDKDVVGLLAAILEPNPRKVKNFLNSLVVTWQVTDTRGMDPCQFALVHYLRVYHPRVHLLAASPAGFESLRNVLAGQAPISHDAEFLARHFAHLGGPRERGNDLNRGNTVFLSPDSVIDKGHRLDEQAVEELGHRLDNYAGELAFKELFVDHFDSDAPPDGDILARLFGRVARKPEEQA